MLCALLIPPAVDRYCLGPDPVSVVTTSTDLKALVQAVGGERVQVESLAPPLHDPHALEVKPGQLSKIKDASLLVRIGLDHEPWLDRALRTLSDRRFVRASPNYLDTSKGIQLLQAETPRVRADQGAHVHGFGNIHYWLDPENSKPLPPAILEALARLAPGEHRYFEANRKRFLDQLDERLKIWFRAMARLEGTGVVKLSRRGPILPNASGLLSSRLSSQPQVSRLPHPTLQALFRRWKFRHQATDCRAFSNASVVRQ